MAAKKPVSSIPDDLTGLSKSLFDTLEAVRSRSPAWPEVDQYFTDHVFVPLDDHIQKHLENHARDRMQGTVKQRKQGHKKPPLPFVQATEYDIRNFSPEYKEELENEVLPHLLRECLADVQGRIVDHLRLLLRADHEVADAKAAWVESSGSFDALYRSHEELQRVKDEYANKEGEIAKVNARTKLVEELTVYYRDQVRPFAVSGVFSHDAYCPPPDVYKMFANKQLDANKAELDAMLGAWEAKNAQSFMVRAARYIDTMKEDVWQPIDHPPNETPHQPSTPRAGGKQHITPTSGAAMPKRLSAKPGAAAGMARKPSTPSKSPQRGTPKTPQRGVGGAQAPPQTPPPADQGNNDPSPPDKPLMIMDRPISHVRAQRDARFDQKDKSNGKRVTVIDTPLKFGSGIDADTYIKVACRIRPLMSHEQGSQAVVSALEDGQTVQLDKPKGARGKPGPTTFKLHYTANPDIQQLEFYNRCDVVPLLDKALNGQYVTVFAYGQTGSGKTYSIAGPEDVIGLHEGVRLRDPDGKVPQSVKDVLKLVLEHQLLQHGIMPRGARHVFDEIVRLEAENPDLQYDVRCTYVEIYNESLYDLLKEDSDALDVKMNAGEREGFYVAGLTEVEAKTTDDVMSIFMRGASNRKVSSHALNRESSRSHALFSMIIEKKTFSKSDNTLWVQRGKVTLVDLAGSESVKTSKTTGKGLLETQGINTSLLHLSNIVASMAKDGVDQAAHIPWRNSKLTMLLMESLANTGTTLMLANVSPSSNFASETINTLSFATKAANISGQRVKVVSEKENEMDSLRTEVFRYKQQNEELEKEVVRLRKLLKDNGIGF